jgi:ribosomal protein S21
MPVEVKKKRSETFESLLRRFNKRIMQSGVLLQFKKVRFLRKEENRNARRSSALYRLSAQGKREYLQKMGLLKEDDRKKKRRR